MKIFRLFQGIADKEMVVHKPVANVTTLDFDKAKKGVKKAKNKIAPDSMCQVSFRGFFWQFTRGVYSAQD